MQIYLKELGVPTGCSGRDRDPVVGEHVGFARRFSVIYVDHFKSKVGSLCSGGGQLRRARRRRGSR